MNDGRMYTDVDFFLTEDVSKVSRASEHGIRRDVPDVSKFQLIGYRLLQPPSFETFVLLLQIFLRRPKPFFTQPYGAGKAAAPPTFPTQTRRSVDSVVPPCVRILKEQGEIEATSFFSESEVVDELKFMNPAVDATSERILTMRKRRRVLTIEAPSNGSFLG